MCDCVRLDTYCKQMYKHANIPGYIIVNVNMNRTKRGAVSSQAHAHHGVRHTHHWVHAAHHAHHWVHSNHHPELVWDSCKVDLRVAKMHT